MKSRRNIKNKIRAEIFFLRALWLRQGALRKISPLLLFSLIPIFFSLFFSFSQLLSAAVVWHPLPEEAYKFGKHYPEAQKLLFAFDYGHALIYEKLLAKKGGVIENPQAFEKELLATILDILAKPNDPKVKSHETDIAPNYTFLFPLAVDLFDWSHLLHQFVLDVMVTIPDQKEMNQKKMEKRVNEIFEIFKANKPVAITDECKSMLFMDGHYFSKAFRRTFPSLNLLIWGYHWFQIKLYEELMNPSLEDQKQGIADVISQFKEMISNLPDSADFDMMPGTFEEAPQFSKMFPKIAASFDNNHMLHDIVSDMLTSDRVKRGDVIWEGIKFARMAWDPNAFRKPTCGE